MEGDNNNIIIYVQGQIGTEGVGQQLENNAVPQPSLENAAIGGQGVGNRQVLQNPLILDSPSIPQSNAEMIMASAAGGMFSI